MGLRGEAGWLLVGVVLLGIVWGVPACCTYLERGERDPKCYVAPQACTGPVDAGP